MPVPPSVIDAAYQTASQITRNPAAPAGYVVYVLPTVAGDAFLTLPEAAMTPQAWQALEALGEQLRARRHLTLLR